MDCKLLKYFRNERAGSDSNWQSAVKKARVLMKGQAPLVNTLDEEQSLQELPQECQPKTGNIEMVALRRTVTRLTRALKAAQEKIENMSEQSRKLLEDRDLEHAKELKALNDKCHHQQLELESTKKELDKLSRQNQKQAELQSQLKIAKEKEIIHQNRILELESIWKEQAKRLSEWNRVSENMTKEMNEVGVKLNCCRYANTKLKEEIGLWKRYCHTADEVRRGVRREADLQKRVLNVFNQVECYLKSESKNRNSTVETLNNIGDNIVADINNAIRLKTIRLVTVECQTEIQDNENDLKKEISKKDNQIGILRDEIIRIEEEQKKILFNLENVTQQNNMLKDVIRSMKKEREELEKEKEHIIEEAIIVKLEEGMKMLKRNLLNVNKDVCPTVKGAKQLS